MRVHRQAPAQDKIASLGWGDRRGASDEKTASAIRLRSGADELCRCFNGIADEKTLRFAIVASTGFLVQSAPGRSTREVCADNRCRTKSADWASRRRVGCRKMNLRPVRQFTGAPYPAYDRRGDTDHITTPCHSSEKLQSPSKSAGSSSYQSDRRTIDGYRSLDTQIGFRGTIVVFWIISVYHAAAGESGFFIPIPMYKYVPHLVEDVKQTMGHPEHERHVRRPNFRTRSAAA